jgi:hypothetical protein
MVKLTDAAIKALEEYVKLANEVRKDGMRKAHSR